MPDPRFKHCKACGKTREEVGEMSWTRLCRYCSEARLLENIDGLENHHGPAFQRWRRATAAAVGAVLLDDVTGNRDSAP